MHIMNALTLMQPQMLRILNPFPYILRERERERDEWHSFRDHNAKRLWDEYSVNMTMQ